MAAPLMVVVGLAQQEAEADAASKIPVELATIGVATVSTVTTLAAAFDQPAPVGLVNDTYFRLALSGTFLAGVTLVGASVWVSDNPAARRGAGKKLLYAAVPPILATVGLSVVALLW